jgi:hypothetical protein
VGRRRTARRRCVGDSGWGERVRDEPAGPPARVRGGVKLWLLEFVLHEDFGTQPRVLPSSGGKVPAPSLAAHPGLGLGNRLLELADLSGSLRTQVACGISLGFVSDGGVGGTLDNATTLSASTSKRLPRRPQAAAQVPRFQDCGNDHCHSIESTPLPTHLGQPIHPALIRLAHRRRVSVCRLRPRRGLLQARAARALLTQRLLQKRRAALQARQLLRLQWCKTQTSAYERLRAQHVQEQLYQAGR